jgi:Transposase IS66 family
MKSSSLRKSPPRPKPDGPSAKSRGPWGGAETDGAQRSPKGAVAERRRLRQLTEQLDYESARFFRRRITLAACWAHVRRKYHESLEAVLQQAGWLLLQIQHLYRIAKHLREIQAGPRLRQAVRASRSRMIVERIHRALSRIKRSRRPLPQSAMGKAIDYTLTL